MLTHEQLLVVHQAAIDAGLTREALLAGVPEALKASLPILPTLGEQLLTDIAKLANYRTLADGSQPARLWLSNAVALTAERTEQAVFQSALGTLATSPHEIQATPRAAPKPDKHWPRDPYPLLEPWTRRETFHGRNADVQALLSDLSEKNLVYCVHAPSGTGKSSFVLAGLIPALWDQGRIVALDRMPDEPGLVARLVVDLAELAKHQHINDLDLEAFVQLLHKLRDVSSQPPVLVIDQFEDAFRPERRDESLSRIGPLFATLAQNALPQNEGFLCQVVLVYRQEFHGAVTGWLEDVLRQARAKGTPNVAGLPRNLKRAPFYRERALPLLADLPNAQNPENAAFETFLSIVKAPLDLKGTDGTHFYKLAFAPGADERLARAFAKARIAQPWAPLSPELQVILHQLVETAKRGEPRSDGLRELTVPPNVEDLLREALQSHLENQLKTAFQADPDSAKTRARALLALRTLCTDKGRRGPGIVRETFIEQLGEGGEALLQKLESARLVVSTHDSDLLKSKCGVPHDQLAAVIVELFRDPAARQRYQVDENLFVLEDNIRLRVELWKKKQADGIRLQVTFFDEVKSNLAFLQWDGERARWWKRVERWQRGKAWQKRVEEEMLRARKELVAKEIRLAQEAKKKQRRNWIIAGVSVLLAAGLGAGYEWGVRRPEQEKQAQAVNLTRELLGFVDQTNKRRSLDDVIALHQQLTQTLDQIHDPSSGLRAARRVADKSVADLLVRLGRNEVVDGKPDRAIMRFLQALQYHDDDQIRREVRYLANEQLQHARILRGTSNIDDAVPGLTENTVLFSDSAGAYLWDANEGGRPLRFWKGGVTDFVVASLQNRFFVEVSEPGHTTIARFNSAGSQEGKTLVSNGSRGFVIERASGLVRGIDDGIGAVVWFPDELEPRTFADPRARKAVLSDDAKTLLTVGDDRVNVWDVQSKKTVYTLPLPNVARAVMTRRWVFVSSAKTSKAFHLPTQSKEKLTDVDALGPALSAGELSTGDAMAAIATQPGQTKLAYFSAKQLKSQWVDLPNNWTPAHVTATGEVIACRPRGSEIRVFRWNGEKATLDDLGNGIEVAATLRAKIELACRSDENADPDSYIQEQLRQSSKENPLKLAPATNVIDTSADTGPATWHNAVWENGTTVEYRKRRGKSSGYGFTLEGASPYNIGFFPGSMRGAVWADDPDLTSRFAMEVVDFQTGSRARIAEVGGARADWPLVDHSAETSMLALRKKGDVPAPPPDKVVSPFSKPRTLELWNMVTLKNVGTLKTADEGGFFKFSKDGSQGVVDGKWWKFDSVEPTLVCELKSEPNIREAAFDPTGRRLALFNGSKGLVVWKAEGCAHTQLADDPGTANRGLVRFDNEGRYLAVVEENRQSVWNLTLGKKLETHEKDVSDWFFLAENRALVVWRDGLRVIEIRPDSIEQVGDLPMRQPDPRTIHLAPDGQHWVIFAQGSLPGHSTAADFFECNKAGPRLQGTRWLSGKPTGGVRWSADSKTVAVVVEQQRDKFSVDTIGFDLDVEPIGEIGTYPLNHWGARLSLEIDKKTGELKEVITTPVDPPPTAIIIHP
ncbi:MAG: ATP-binding protein [Polyangiaceae bacterium]|nr:ATP-binding protein [Polyangiaceae bacterium]